MSGVTSLHPSAWSNSGRTKVPDLECERIGEDVLELPHVLLTADVSIANSNVPEVVLAGGVRRALGQHY